MTELLSHPIPNLFLLFLGFYVLVKGADILVSGAGSMAKKWGISSLVIGLTIVAFGTSAPELTVNTIASFAGASGITLGNVIGSNIANILLGIGIIALIRPVVIAKNTAWKEIPFLMLATFLLWTNSSDHILDRQAAALISRSESFMLLGFFVLFMVYTFGISKNEDTEEEETETFSTAMSLLLFLGGIIGLTFGGKLVVMSSINIASSFGLSESLIGLTVVALGTSVPDIVTTVVAAYKNKMGMAVGNIVGSNIFNILLVLGVSGLIHPIPVELNLQTDLLFCLAITVFLFLSFHLKKIAPTKRKHQKHQISKGEGVLLVLLYVGYMIFLVLRG